MADELLALGRAIGDHLTRIADRGPEVVASYQKRLTERVQALVQSQGVTIEPKDLIREVAIFAERADITEEIVRLRAHLAQYVEVIDEPESSGRKLEFVVQEMGRETNTIGSKANDVEISRCGRRDQGAAREDPRADPERRVIRSQSGGSRAMWVAGRGRAAGSARGGLGPVGLRQEHAHPPRPRSIPRSKARALGLGDDPAAPARRAGRGRLSLPEPRASSRRPATGEFLEWAEYNGHFYGTPAKPVFEALAAGRSVLLEIEVQGALQVREHGPVRLLRLHPDAHVPDPRAAAAAPRDRGRVDDPPAAPQGPRGAGRGPLVRRSADQRRPRPCVEEFVAALQLEWLWRMIPRCSKN